MKWLYTTSTASLDVFLTILLPNLQFISISNLVLDG